MFYDEPPRCQINLETMDTLAVERLRFLRVMEKHASLSGNNYNCYDLYFNYAGQWVIWSNLLTIYELLIL